MSDLILSSGFHEDQRASAACLYWEAFGGKLAPVMRPQAKALNFLADVMDPAFAISASDETGALLGLAGFKTSEGSLVGGGLTDLARTYGWIGALWRGAILSVLERKISPGILLMDGICVSAEARSRGVGTRLLDAILEEAQKRKMRAVRLDVIDTNPRARALYERFGFQADQHSDIGPLRHIFGFRGSTSMIYTISR